MSDYKRKGISEAGAPMYKGKWNKPPIGVALGHVLMLFMVLVFVQSAVHRWYTPARHNLFSPEIDRWFQIASNIAFIPVAISMGLSGVWMLKTRYRLRRLQTTDQICTQMGMDDDLFHAWREQQTIKPHININGTDYYRPSDFVDAGTLLRASTRPVTSETLLRPGMYVEAAAPEQLLRAAE